MTNARRRERAVSIAGRSLAIAVTAAAGACHAPSDSNSAPPIASQSAEPVKPTAALPAPSAAETAFDELLAGMGIRVHRASRSIEVAGWVNMQTGLVEVFACAPEGKTHESVVVVLDCLPSGP